MPRRNQSKPLDQYKRAYKACHHCRKIKAKCDATSDAETCLRCQRERRQCIFPTQRSLKRRRTADGLSEIRGDDRVDVDVRASWDASTQGANLLMQLAESASDEAAECNSSIDNEIPPNDGTEVMASGRDALNVLFRAAQVNDQGRDDRASTNVGIWEDYELVKTSLLTAAEAAQYIELFFLTLSPLSAIPDTYYAEHKNQKYLYQHEPLLCVVMLMISSRYNTLPGQSLVRSIVLHDRLWRHAQNLIFQLMLGSDSDRELRTIGTIQALLLITDWHPRSLHFPQNDRVGGAEPQSQHPRMFKAAQCSDRMSWTFLGLAVTLAHELDIFQMSQAGVRKATARQCIQIQRLLYIFVTHLAIRLGYSSLIDSSLTQNAFEKSLFDVTQADQLEHSDRETMVLKWATITTLLEGAIDALKSNRNQGYNYLDLIEDYENKLSAWWVTLHKAELSTCQESTRTILLLEYHHVRVCINSIALPKISNRSTTIPIASSPTIFLSPGDSQAVATIRQSSCDMLNIATKLHQDHQILRLCPVRVFLRIIAAAIFLLKVLSLPLDWQFLRIEESFACLGKCIEALKHCHADDEHLSTRYGVLLERHADSLKKALRKKQYHVNHQQQQSHNHINHNNHVDENNTLSNSRAENTSAATAFSPPPDPDLNTILTEPDLQHWPLDSTRTSLDNGNSNGDLTGTMTPFLNDEDYMPGLALDSMDFFWNISPA